MQGIIPFANKHGSTILTIIGSTGVVITTILGIKATPKALEIIKEEENKRIIEEEKCFFGDNKSYKYISKENNNPLTLKDKVKLTWKEYIPTIISGVGTISCIFGANILNKRTQASLTSSYILLKKYFDEYKLEANKTYELEKGQNANQKIQKTLFEKKIKRDPPKNIQSNNDEILLYLPLYSTTHHNDGYITTKKSTVLNLEKMINDEIYKEGHICINKIYKWLGIKDKDLPAWGWQYGWVKPYDIIKDTNYDIYKLSIELTKCELDDDFNCWYLDANWPEEMESFV